MKSKTLFTLSWLLIATAQAQESDPGQDAGKFTIHNDNSTSYYSTSDRTLNTGQQYLQEKKRERRRDELSSKFEIGLFSRFNPKIELLGNVYGAPVRSISKTYPSYIIPDSSAVLLVALGINPQNLKDYKYRVVKNDSIELVPWSPIPKLEKKYGAEVPYGNIGTFKSPGDILMIEVLNTKDYSTRDGVIYDWRADYKPQLTVVGVNISGGYYDLMDLKENNKYVKKSPSYGNALQLQFPADSLLGISLGFRHHETIPYNIYLEKMKGDSVAESVLIEYYLQADDKIIDNGWLRTPGKYRFKIVRTESLPGQYDKKQALYVPFEVKPRPVVEKKASLKQAIPYIMATLSGVALLFFVYYRYNQGRLKASAREKQLARLKLKSIRAQLNPHFMFNALSSIQNLINKNDISSANYYLSIFSGLTRQVLDTGNEDMLSLEDELRVLDDYLQMEQLRFGFTYQISTDPIVNTANTDIPAMLLQPFVENAVKHGVSVLKNRGDINIAVHQEHNDLLLSVSDNGAGFEQTPTPGGYGLKLTEERIALLNQIYKGQTVTLNIHTTSSGTQITIRLTNWIS